jgi:hypothetical protein
MIRRCTQSRVLVYAGTPTRDTVIYEGTGTFARVPFGRLDA